jgi:hypothetical protein
MEGVFQSSGSGASVGENEVGAVAITVCRTRGDSIGSIEEFREFKGKHQGEFKVRRITYGCDCLDEALGSSQGIRQVVSKGVSRSVRTGEGATEAAHECAGVHARAVESSESDVWKR